MPFADQSTIENRTISAVEGTQILDLFRNRFGIINLDRGPLAGYRESSKRFEKRPELMACLTPDQPVSRS